MDGTQKKYYIEANDDLQGYDIFKRDGIEQEDGTVGPERICTIYSMDYLDSVIDALIGEDTREDVEMPADFVSTEFREEE